MSFLEEIKKETTRGIWLRNSGKINEIKETIREFASFGKTECSVNAGDNPEQIIRYFEDLGFELHQDHDVSNHFSNLYIRW